MPIYLTKTETVSTQQDIEAGGCGEGEIVFNNRAHTFHELIALLRDEFTVCSCWPITTDIYTWFQTDPETNFRTGDVREQSLHYGTRNPTRNAKYWAKAIRYVFKEKVRA